MKSLLASAFVIASLAVQTGSAAAQHMEPRGAIPAQFQGRWAASQRACRGPENVATIITISRRGWSSFEDGGELQRVGQVRSGTHYFRMLNVSGDTETGGSLALRRSGARLIMTFRDDGYPPNHHNMIRCR